MIKTMSDYTTIKTTIYDFLNSDTSKYINLPVFDKFYIPTPDNPNPCEGKCIGVITNATLVNAEEDKIGMELTIKIFKTDVKSEWWEDKTPSAFSISFGG